MGIFDMFQNKSVDDKQAEAAAGTMKEGDVTMRSAEFEPLDVDITIPEEEDDASKEITQKLAELQRYRNELNEVSSDLSSSEGLFRASVERVKSLSSIISDTEVHLSTLKRVDKENRIAQNELTQLRQELEREKMWAQEQEIRANTYEARHDELINTLAESRKQITALMEKTKVLQDKVAGQESTINQIEALRTELARDLEKYRKEANTYKATADKLTEDVAIYNRSSLEMEKRIEELTSANKAGKREREELENSLKSLVAKYNELKADSFATKSKLESAMFEVKSAERNYGEKIKYRENELFSLRTSIDELKSQLRIREQVSARAERDLADWKKYAREESQKVHDLEIRLHDQSEEMGKMREALAQAKSNSDDINNRYLNALSDLDTLKEQNNSLLRKLEQYTALGSVAKLEQVAARKAEAKEELPEADPSISSTSKH